MRAHSSADPVAVSERERQILTLLAQGLTMIEAAQQMNYSQRTVKSWVRTFRQKHGLKTVNHAIAFAIANKMIMAEEPRRCPTCGR